jgi:hypothetical protein
LSEELVETKHFKYLKNPEYVEIWDKHQDINIDLPFVRIEYENWERFKESYFNDYLIFLDNGKDVYLNMGGNEDSSLYDSTE